MNDICACCGGAHQFTDCSDFKRVMKNLRFALAYGGGKRAVVGAFTTFKKGNNMDSFEIKLTAPAGYEFTGGYRQAKVDEYYAVPIVTFDGFHPIRVELRKCELSATNGFYYILRPKWVWPEWITAPYIAMDEDGNWYAYLVQPSMKSTSWCGGTCSYLGKGLNAFTPPPCTDWKQSLRRNPNDAS